MIDYNSIISKRIMSVKESGIREFFGILESMPDAISLGLGEPDFKTPLHIREDGIRLLENGHIKYSANAGLPALRQELQAYLKRRFSLDYDAETEILVTVGGSEAIDLALRVLVDPGDEVLIPEPSFVCYGPITTVIGGVAVGIPMSAENGFRLTPEQLERAITPKTKVLVLPYPSNPTGGIMEREDLEAIAPLIIKHNLIVLSDEIYSELTYGGKRHVSPATIDGLYERTAVINGMSKAYSMTGWRIGYVCAPRPLAAAMTKLHQYAVMCAPTISQCAAITAVKNGDADIEAMRAEYDVRRRWLVDRLNSIGLDCFEPKGAFYVFPSIKISGLGSEEFAKRLLLEEKVAVVAGNAFGESGEGFVRMCYAASMENLEEALARTERFLERLRKEVQ